jgi:hypothetical protein
MSLTQLLLLAHKCNKHADWRHVRSCAGHVHREVLIAGQRFRAQPSSASKSGIKSASSVCHALNLGEMTRQLIKK